MGWVPERVTQEGDRVQHQKQTGLEDSASTRVQIADVPKACVSEPTT